MQAVPENSALVQVLSFAFLNGNNRFIGEEPVLNCVPQAKRIRFAYQEEEYDVTGIHIRFFGEGTQVIQEVFLNAYDDCFVPIINWLEDEENNWDWSSDGEEETYTLG